MALLDVIFPTDCAGCGAPGSLVCLTCRSALSGVARPAWPRPVPAGLPPPWSVLAYEGPARELLLAYKEHGAVGARQILARPLAASLVAAVAAAGGGRVLVVPVPSSGRAVRARGGDVVLDLSRCAAALARSDGVDCRAVRVLRHGRRVADSAGLTSGARADNLAGAFAVRRFAAGALAGSRVVIADDLVTTGASLAEAARAVRAVGAEVIGGATVAATQRRDSRAIVGTSPPRATVRR